MIHDRACLQASESPRRIAHYRVNEARSVEWALKMRQTVKPQNSLNGESDEFVSTKVHQRV
jgi:hypothetical protein